MDQRSASDLTENPYDELDRMYDAWVGAVAYDIDFYRAMAHEECERRGIEKLRIIELGAGSGRITMPLLRDGHAITAIDISGRQLDLLRQKAVDEGLAASLHTICGDMLDLSKLVDPGSAHLIISPFRALMHVSDKRDQLFPQIHTALQDGGAFSFDVHHPHPQDIFAPPFWMIRSVVVDEEAGGRWALWESAHYELDGSFFTVVLRFELHTEYVDETPDAPLDNAQIAAMPGARVLETTLSMHAPNAHEVRESLETAGLMPESVHGWFDGRPYELDSSESVWVTRRT